MLDSIKNQIRSLYYNYYYDYIRPILNPQHSKIRNAIPKTWCDISELIPRVNFEFIKSFYEDEYKAGIVDWDATEKHKEFADWLEKSYEYVTKIRPQLNTDLENAYPPFRLLDEIFERVPQEDGTTRIYLKNDRVPYEVKYKDVIRLENEIKERDTEILTGVIQRRDFFWT